MESDVLTAMPEVVHWHLHSVHSVSGFTLLGTSLVIKESLVIIFVLWDITQCLV